MGLEFFCQLWTNSKLLLIIFNTTIYRLLLCKYNCTLGLINKLYLKTLLYMQLLHKIFVVIQNHKYRLLLCRLLHLYHWVFGLTIYVIHHIFMKSNSINIYFSNFLLKWLDLTLWIIVSIKLISREYFISPLRNYEFHLKNICSINTKCGCPIYWGFDHNFGFHSWYIKATYTSWSCPLFS